MKYYRFGIILFAFYFIYEGIALLSGWIEYQGFVLSLNSFLLAIVLFKLFSITKERKN